MDDDLQRDTFGTARRYRRAGALVATTATLVVVNLNVLTATASAAPAVRTATTTTANANPRTSTKGDPVTYRAAVRATSGSRALTGTVTFAIGSRTLCAATVVLTRNASSMAGCTTTNTPLGVNTVTATYSGDPIFAQSTGTTTAVVDPRDHLLDDDQLADNQ
ncbi:MAG: Ig-like domain-containing protein [Actinomycetota bacterium]|nr:Ig-like domain-containing protein [Actinomycetota bacterium]